MVFVLDRLEGAGSSSSSSQSSVTKLESFGPLLGCREVDDGPESDFACGLFGGGLGGREPGPSFDLSSLVYLRFSA